MVNMAMKPRRTDIGVLQPQLAAPAASPSQLKIFTPVGTAISIVEMANAEFAVEPRPVGEHVVRPHAPATCTPMAMPENTTTG